MVFDDEPKPTTSIEKTEPENGYLQSLDPFEVLNNNLVRPILIWNDIQISQG